MMTPTSSALERAVQSYVSEGAGLIRRDSAGEITVLDVLVGKRGKVAPTTLFGTVTLIADSEEGTAWTRQTPAGLMTFESRSVSYSVQFFNKGAHDAARRLRLWAKSPQGRSVATMRGLTLYRFSAVRNLDDIVSAEWEERSGIDLELGYVAILDQVVDTGITLGITVFPDNATAFDVDPGRRLKADI